MLIKYRENTTQRWHFSLVMGFFLCLTVLFLLFGPTNTPEARAASLLQSVKATVTNDTSVSATFAATPTSGNLLIAVVGAFDNVTINGISGWNVAINQSGTPGLAIFYRVSDGTEGTVTGTTTTSTGALGIHIYEYSGTQTVLDQTNSNTGSSGTPSTGSISTTEADELLFAAFAADGNTNFSNASWSDAEGFSERNDFKTTGAPPDLTHSAGDNLTNSAGTHSVTVSISATHAWRGQIVSFRANNPPTGSFNSAVQTSDGSGNAALSIEVDDTDNDKTKAKLEFETDSDGACDGPWSLATLLNPATADFNDSGGAPNVNNLNVYRIGKGLARRIITSSGSNTIDFTWDSSADLSSVNGTQCLRLIVNDDAADQAIAATQTVTLDNVAPSISSTTISPSSGTAKVGDTLAVTVTSGEIGLSVGTCSVNGADVSGTFTDNLNNTYTVSYVVTEGNSDWSSGSLSVSCTLQDAVGNSVTINAFTDSYILAGDATSPTGLTALTTGTTSKNSQVLDWSAVTEANFDHYEIWFGTNEPDVQNRTGTASQSDQVDDATLLARTTTTTTISGLNSSTTYFYKIFALDTAGNEETIPDIVQQTQSPTGSGTTAVLPKNYSIQINDGSDCTATPNVILSLVAQSTSSFVVGNDELFVGSDWEPFYSSPTMKDLILEEGDGEKTVYVRFRSQTGNLSGLVTDTILLNEADACDGVTAIFTAEEEPVLGEEVAPTVPSAECPIDCDKATHDLYLVNPDGSERHMNTDFVQIEDLGNNILRINFEDKGLDFDYDDITLTVDSNDCKNILVSVEQVNAGWHHQIKMQLSYAGELKADLLLWPDSHEAVGRTQLIKVEDEPDICAAAQEAIDAEKASLKAGDVIKGSKNTVYYYGSDGKRHAFPNLRTYLGWYSDFNALNIVSDSILASLPLGSNVTFKPGNLIKLQSDPKVYGVSFGAVLRWVKTETIAVAIAGNSWASLVHDVSDAFFTNYTVGDSVESIADFDPDLEKVRAPTIDVNMGFAEPPSLIEAPEEEGVGEGEGETPLCTSDTTFTAYMLLGTVGEQVRSLQTFLQCLGHFPAEIAPTGYFGPVTQQAVIDFQNAYGINPLGVVGPATRAVLNGF